MEELGALDVLGGVVHDLEHAHGGGLARVGVLVGEPGLHGVHLRKKGDNERR